MLSKQTLIEDLWKARVLEGEAQQLHERADELHRAARRLLDNVMGHLIARFEKAVQESANPGIDLGEAALVKLEALPEPSRGMGQLGR